jgi:transposase
MSLDHHFAEPTAIRTNLGRYLRLVGTQSFDLVDYIALAGRRRKMSKHGLSAGNIAALLARLSELKQKAFARTGQSFQAGLDGFWIHRVLQSEGVESRVVDSASIASSQRRRRAKTNRTTRSPGARSAGVQTRRTAGLRHGQDADARGRRPPPTLP